MNKSIAIGMACLLSSISSIPGFAQSTIGRNELISSLQGAQKKVEISADELQKAALENIAKYPGANSPKTLQLAEKLAGLRQFVIEVNFDFDSARIRPASYRAVGLIADALHTPYLLGQTFFIVGHTDAKGARDYNLELSKRRADAIREALVTTFMVPRERLFAVGLGEEQLRDPANPEATGNRRVQLINVGYR